MSQKMWVPCKCSNYIKKKIMGLKTRKSPPFFCTISLSPISSEGVAGGGGGGAGAGRGGGCSATNPGAASPQE